MPKKLSKILAVNPLSRCLGIAYFHGHALREWQVKNIRSSDSKEAARKAATELLRSEGFTDDGIENLVFSTGEKYKKSYRSNQETSNKKKNKKKEKRSK